MYGSIPCEVCILFVHKRYSWHLVRDFDFLGLLSVMDVLENARKWLVLNRLLLILNIAVCKLWVLSTFLCLPIKIFPDNNFHIVAFGEC